MTRVVATVLVHDNDAGLHEVLRRLHSQELAPRAIVVVDNGSTPPVDPSQLPTGDVPTRLVRADGNLGVGGGHNLAVRLAHELWQPDAVWVLEHDTFPDAGCLRALVAERSRHADPVVVVTELVRNNYERTWIPLAADAALVDRFTFNGPLIDQAIIDAVGPFNESFFVGQEDWEYSQRVHAHGFKIVRCVSAVARHAHKGEHRFAAYVSPTRLYYSSRNLVAARRPLSRWVQLRELLLTTGKCVRELTRRHRGRRYAAARWWAYWDGRAGRLGERHHPSISGPSGPSTPSTARAA